MSLIVTRIIILNEINPEIWMFFMSLNHNKYTK